MKSGYKTSEFYVALLSIIVGGLVTTGYLTPDESEVLEKLGVEVVGGILALVAVVTYITGRVELKKETIKSAVKG